MAPVVYFHLPHKQHTCTWVQLVPTVHSPKVSSPRASGGTLCRYSTWYLLGAGHSVGTVRGTYLVPNAPSPTNSVGEADSRFFRGERRRRVGRAGGHGVSARAREGVLREARGRRSADHEAVHGGASGRDGHSGEYAVRARSIVSGIGVRSRFVEPSLDRGGRTFAGGVQSGRERFDYVAGWMRLG